jgi:hypothetical protein
MLSSEGVLGEAELLVFAHAGFNHLDQTPGQWLNQRVMMGNAVQAFSGFDKGCRGGNIFDAHLRHYEKGKSIFWVLPKKYKKSAKHSPGNFSTHRTKTFSHRIVIRVRAIGFPECGNPVIAEVVVEIYVEVSHKKHEPKPKPPVTPVVPPVVPPVVTPPSPTPPAPITCLAGEVMINSVCHQENKAEQECLAKGGSWDSVAVTCTIIQVNGNCSNIFVINGSGNVINNYQEGNCKVEEKKTPTCAEVGEVGVFPNCRPHTCEELGTCPPPPNCAERGEVGTFPNCHPRTCEETGTCPPPPHCEHGEVGTPPNCRPKTCQELNNCPPPPTPPTIVSVTTINDLDAEGFSENFCVTAEVPGNDTGTLVMAPRYGSFGPLGGTVTVTFTGTTEKCVTYYAPTEVPPGEHDKMKVTLRDNTTGLSATPDEQEFRIKPVPVNPG